MLKFCGVTPPAIQLPRSPLRPLSKIFIDAQPDAENEME